MTVVGLEGIYAEWGYGEIDSPRWLPSYGGDVADALRARKKSGVRLEDMTQQEVELLAAYCRIVRSGLGHYLRVVKAFALVSWDKNQIGAIYCLDKLANPGQARAQLRDAGVLREAFKAELDLTKEATGGPPLILGLDQFAELVLIDGYHRCVHFLEHASPEATIATYVPLR